MISCQNKHCAAPRVLCFSISFKVSSVLCQISCFSLHVCQLQIKSRSLIDKSQYKNKLTNTHANVVRPFGSHFQNIKKYQVLEKNIPSFLSGLSLSISLGSHSVAYVQQLRGCDKKKFPTSIHWAGNRLKGRECNWSVLPYTTSLKFCTTKNENNVKTSIQKIPGTELRKNRKRGKFSFVSASMVVSYCRVRKNGKYI